MLRRGARRARAEKFRDRDAPVPTTHVAAPGQIHRYNYGAAALGPVAPRDGKSAVRFQWAGGPARAISLVASFDGFMHHRMHRISLGHRAGPTTFEVTLRIAPGTYTYKFLVDGVWCTDKHAPHPIEASSDGLLHHKFVVEPLSSTSEEQQMHLHNNHTLRSVPPSPEASGVALSNALDLADARHGPRGTSYSVVRSSSVSELRSAPGSSSSAANLRSQGLVGDHSARSFASLTNSATRGGGHDRLDRPSSFMVSMSEQSPGSAHRKSLLHRVGSGWMRRFSGRNHSNVNEEIMKAHEREPAVASGGAAPLTAKKMNSHSSSGVVRASTSAIERSGIFLFRSDASGADKENGGNYSGSSGRKNPGLGTPERTVLRRNNGIRGSGRAAAVKISGPTMVDEPKSVEEVNRQADNWRQMARHLQENLSDPSGARELLSKAIKHREKHGLWCTVENAQTHVDLARNLSKADRMGDAEFHLRIALRIYKQVEAGPEHIGDLLHYIGVVVDRQKKRSEAEELYRSALDTYKKNRLTGNNVEIALKNLKLNLKKQNREKEAEKYVRAYYGYVEA